MSIGFSNKGKKENSKKLEIGLIDWYKILHSKYKIPISNFFYDGNSLMVKE